MGKRDQSIADKLRAAITAAEREGSTRAEIARKAGVNESQISRLMSGKSKTLSVANLEKIAEALGGWLEFRKE